MTGPVAILVYAVCAVAGFVAGLLAARFIREAGSPFVFKLLRKHFAPISLETLSVTERQFPARIRVDLQRSLDEFFRSHVTVEHLCGIRHQETMMFGPSLSELLSRQTQALAVPLEHEEIDIGEQSPVRCARNALWLVDAKGEKAAILLSQVFAFNEPPRVRFDIATPNTEGGSLIMRRFYKTLELAVQQAKSYRGKILSLEPAEGYTGQSTGITVHSLPPVTRDEVILPDHTLKLLERNVLQFVEQRSRLGELGQSTKKGLLFYGPPGNGKTHTIRYLISELEGHTTLIITAEQVAQLGEYMALARLLQPTMVIIEDVDLIAREREQSGGPCQESLLNKLLNEMDGLKEDTETVFLLTTNRPQQLEEALASRPGRIDQVIEFPYPDATGREKLVRLYSKAVSLGDGVAESVVSRTAGVSAAFIKELMRRAIQFHLVNPGEQAVGFPDVENALQEMLTQGGSLNRRVLGAGQNSETALESYS